ncbi:LOW QUALITY PROTEIN: vitrin-like [Urocitellus parryii]
MGHPALLRFGSDGEPTALSNRQRWKYSSSRPQKPDHIGSDSSGGIDMHHVGAGTALAPEAGLWLHRGREEGTEVKEGPRTTARHLPILVGWFIWFSLGAISAWVLLAMPEMHACPEEVGAFVHHIHRGVPCPPPFRSQSSLLPKAPPVTSQNCVELEPSRGVGPDLHSQASPSAVTTPNAPPGSGSPQWPEGTLTTPETPSLSQKANRTPPPCASQKPHLGLKWVQAKCYQLLLSVFQHSNRALSTPYIHSLAPIVVEKLKAVERNRPSSNNELLAVQEGIKVLETLVALGEKQNNKSDVTRRLCYGFQRKSQKLDELLSGMRYSAIGCELNVNCYLFNDNPANQFNLKTHMNSRDLKRAIERITQRGGLSNVGWAISFVTKTYFSKANGNRGGAPSVAVVMVDSWPTDKVEEASRLARELGINIFFITVEAAVENEKQYVMQPNFANKVCCVQNQWFNVQSWLGFSKTMQPLVKRVYDTDRLACSKTCLNSADIGFFIDGSSSVGTGNFRTVLQFVANISKEFEISDTDTRKAVQSYEQRLEFGFDKYSTKPDILNAIKRVGYWSDGTSTGASIHYALEKLFKKSKPNKRKLMILITEGSRTYDDVRIPAMATHQRVITCAIGVAWDAQDKLEVIATHPARDHSFFVDEFDNLYKSNPRIIQNICTEFNAKQRN